MKNLYPVVLLILLAFSCKKEDKVKVIERSFGDEISLRSNLSITFNQELVPDSLVGAWIEEPLLEITPEVEGIFKWQETNTLVFIPRNGFAPSTRYSCKITNKVFKEAKGLSFEGDRVLNFSTPMVELESTYAYWEVVEEEVSAPVIKFDVSFNQPVAPELLESLLHVEIDGTEMDYDIQTTEAASKISLVVNGLGKDDKTLDAKLTIAEGLTAYGGTEKTTEKYVEKIEIPSPFKLEISEIVANHDGIEGTVTVYTTQKVNESEVQNYLKMEPKAKYKIEVLSNSFIIRSSEFSLEAKYDVTIEKGLTGALGGELKRKFSQPVSFGKVEPTIRFNDRDEFYVSGKGSGNIEVTIFNVPKVKVQITKLYENNITRYLKRHSFGSSSHTNYDEYYYEDYYYNDCSEDIGSLGDVVLTQEYETNELQRYGLSRILNLNFEDKFGDYPGVYHVEIKSAEDYYLKAAKLLSVSDIGLIVKNGKNSISVFANSIKTAKPMDGVSISFIGRNNQVVHTAKTGADGAVTYEYEELLAPGFKTKLVTAKLGSDFNIIPLRQTRVNTSRFEVGGKYQNASGLEAFIYGDRNLYRPGENANITAIIRDYDWQVPGELPVILKIVTPTGKSFKSIRKTLNKYGSFETTVPLPASATTGAYTLNIFTSNNILIGSSVMKVEEFMPDRIKVKVETDKKEYKPGEEIQVDAVAENFFGPPAAGRNYQVEVSTKRLNFYPKQNREYNYYINGADTYFDNKYREGETDEAGKLQENFDISYGWKNMGILKTDIFTTVFDETGRPVNNLNSVKIYTQDAFYGIKRNSYYNKTGHPVLFGLIAVDKEGKALNGVQAQIELIKHEYKTVLSKSGKYFRYRSEKVEKVLVNKTLTLNGKDTKFNFVPEESGRYELKIRKKGTNAYVNSHFYAYGWGRTSFSSFEVDKEGQIDIEPDKENYNVGEKANVILKTPFSGKVLVTVESDKVLKHFYVETDNRAASFELDITEEYLPNVYITATLFKPHEKSDMPLTVAHGFVPIKVDNPEYKIPVQITAVEKSRSNTKQKIKVKARPNSAVTIAVVDEGILQVAKYATPDPYGYYYQKRALEVSTSDVYPYMFPEVGMLRSKTGGDGMDMDKRINPFKNERVKLVSFWSGIIETNNSGEAEYEVDIPQFSGDLRIMAVSYGSNDFGASHTNMKVADPLVLSVGLPRFLSPGDKIDVPVVMTNTTEKSAKSKTTITVEGPLKIVGEKSKSLTIEPNREGKVEFEVEANYEIGQGAIVVTTGAMSETFTNRTDITVRPASPLQKRYESGSIAAGKKKTISNKPTDFIESSVDCKLIISKNPLVEFTRDLDYLVRYPHGCVEQTVSKAFPQLYFPTLAGLIDSDENKMKNQDAIKNVQLALDRIKLMQLHNGGLTYWPGRGSETWWGSAYAAHFAIEAQKAGYDVDEDFLKKLLKYLKSKLKEKKLFTYYYNYNKKKEIAPKEVAYSLYILSLAGEKPTSLLNYYRNRTHQLSLDSKYMLAAAYALTGDKVKYKEILPPAFEGEKSERTFGGSFYSYIRDEAIALNVLLEADPENRQIGIMSKHVSEYLKTHRYLNTQERTFSFLALGKIAKRAEESDIKGSVLANGKKIAEFDNNTVTLSTDKLKGKDVSIECSGTGRVYYFFEIEGISADGTYEEVDEFIRVRRNYYDRYGRKITGNTVNQTDLILVEVNITGLTDKHVENVAITDLLPAGFEIENPRLTTLPPGMDYPNDRNYPEYMDIRDDRIIYFTTVSKYTKHFYYLVRAVSKGTFNVGPVGADAMYNGEYHSYHGAGTLVVTDK